MFLLFLHVRIFASLVAQLLGAFIKQTYTMVLLIHSEVREGVSKDHV
jgi:hypothetical protein